MYTTIFNHHFGPHFSWWICTPQKFRQLGHWGEILCGFLYPHASFHEVSLQLFLVVGWATHLKHMLMKGDHETPRVGVKILIEITSDLLFQHFMLGDQHKSEWLHWYLSFVSFQKSFCFTVAHQKTWKQQNPHEQQQQNPWMTFHFEILIGSFFGILITLPVIIPVYNCVVFHPLYTENSHKFENFSY